MKKILPFFIFVLILFSCPNGKIEIPVDESAQGDGSHLLPLQMTSIKASVAKRPSLVLKFNKEIQFSSVQKEAISIVESKGKMAITQFELREGLEKDSFTIRIMEDLTENKNYELEIAKVVDIYQISTKVKTNFWTGFFAPVNSTIPEDYEGEFFIDTLCEVQFVPTASIDPATVTASSVWVHPRGNESNKLDVVNFNYDPASKKVTFNIKKLDAPKSGLACELVVSDKVLYTDSTPILPLTISFTAKNRPIVASTVPADGASLASTDRSISVVFVAGLDFRPDSINSTNIYVKEKDGSTPLASSSFLYDYGTRTCSFTLDAPLNSFRSYQLVVENLVFANEVLAENSLISFSCVDGVDPSLMVGSNFSSYGMKQPTFGPDPKDGNYVIVFEDDFNTPFTNEIQTHENSGAKYTHTASPDPAKWDVITDFFDNGWYKAKQAWIDSDKGRLIIQAKTESGVLNRKPSEDPQSYNRVSGRVQSKQKFGFLYGKVTAKFKASKEASWPALWFITNAEKFKDEIDMLEYYPHKDPKKWESVFHAGSGEWGGSMHWGGGNNLDNHYSTGGKILYDYDAEATMVWENDSSNNSSIKIDADLYTPYTDNKVVSDINVCPLKNMGKRYLRPMYPILEIQVRGYGVTDSQWNSSSPSVAKEFEIDYLRITQKASRRYATLIDEFFTEDNFIKTPGVRKAHFNYPNVEGINYGCFEYGGQPLYETDLLMVDESKKEEQQSIIYRVKNVRGVSLLAYFHPGLVGSIPRTSFNSIDKNTGFPNKSIDSYANNPGYDFKIEVASSLGGPWSPMPFDARWDGNDTQYPGACIAKSYEKIAMPERNYNYVKILFPKVGDNWQKIFLGKVVFTRYEGTDFDNYKIEGEL